MRIVARAVVVRNQDGFLLPESLRAERALLCWSFALIRKSSQAIGKVRKHVKQKGYNLFNLRNQVLPSADPRSDPSENELSTLDCCVDSVSECAMQREFPLWVCEREYWYWRVGRRAG